MLRWLQTRLSSLFRRGRYERELDAELRFHLDMLTEQHVRAGMPERQARAEALRAFGQVARVKDDVRDAWLSRLVETLGQDLRYGARSIRRSPGFAFAVIVTMALGIGANTAIFSVVNGVLLRPLPYEDGHELVVLRQQQPLTGSGDLPFSYQEILDYRTRSKSLDGVVEFHSMWFILLGGAEPQRVSTGVVSANYFDVLGVKPLHGRTFVEADDGRGAEAVLVLSHAYWQRSFGGDPGVVGTVFQMNDRPHQVIGVLPPVPQYPEPVDVYMPTSACPFRSAPQMVDARDGRMMRAFARLKDDIRLEKAQADLGIVAASLQQEYPDAYPAAQGYRAVASPLQDELTQSFRTTLLVLMGTAGFVLLIVCASLANLMLARLVRRQHELAVRSVLGAGRLRLIRQLLTESTLLALLGGVAGLALAHWGRALLVAFASRFTQRAAEIQIDGAVLAYTLGVSVLTGLVFGAVPAFSRRFGSRESLGDGSRTTQGRQGVRSALIVVQVAASFMLLIGAGLTVRSVLELQQIDPGIRTDNVLTMRIDLNFTKYPDPPRRAEFWARLEERLKAVPGAIGVGGAATFPLNERGPFPSAIQIQGRALPVGVARPQVGVRVATPDYFVTLAQPLLAGRFFRLSDRLPDTARGEAPDNGVVIVNQSMARHYWPDRDPIGERISGNEGRTWLTVVGVVADARQHLDEPAADEVYIPMLQSGQLTTTWLVRSNLDPSVMQRQVRDAVHSVDPDQPVDNFRTLAEVRSASLTPPRLTATLLASFGVLALVITATGLAGVIAFSVNQRTQEFGIRMALGAARGRVLGMVLRQGLQLVLVGLALGLAGALVLTRVLETLLFGIEPTDLPTFAVVSLVLLAVAALACFVPARRAATVDPIVALRIS